MMPAMRIAMICPAPPRSRFGNRISALRWARILRGLGHQVAIETRYEGARCDLLIALHAKRSAAAVQDFAARHPEKPVVIALTGTDVYRDIRRSRLAQRALEWASRLIVLQPLAIEELAPMFHAKVRVIYQSVEKTPEPAPRRDFQVVVAGHLRTVKDPFRTAMAVRRLPPASRIRVVHAGAAMDDRMAARARLEEQRNSRYRWVGELPRSRARRLIAASRLLVLSSRMEGGANVISEAIVDGTPVLASRIPGSVGLLGTDYPGYYRFGDTRGLRELLLRAEADPGFYSDLAARVRKLAPRFRPECERGAWRDLLSELSKLDAAPEPEA